MPDEGLDYTDGLGTWRKLGKLQATKNWQLFNVACGRSTVFRLSYTLPETTWEQWRFEYYQQTYGLLRAHYMDDNALTFTTVGTAFSIFPKPETQILTVGLNSELKDNLFVNRKIAIIQKNYRRNRYLGNEGLAELIKWEVAIDALIPET